MVNVKTALFKSWNYQFQHCICGCSMSWNMATQIGRRSHNYLWFGRYIRSWHHNSLQSYIYFVPTIPMDAIIWTLFCRELTPATDGSNISSRKKRMLVNLAFPISFEENKRICKTNNWEETSMVNMMKGRHKIADKLIKLFDARSLNYNSNNNTETSLIPTFVVNQHQRL